MSLLKSLISNRGSNIEVFYYEKEKMVTINKTVWVLCKPGFNIIASISNPEATSVNKLYLKHPWNTL